MKNQRLALQRKRRKKKEEKLKVFVCFSFTKKVERRRILKRREERRRKKEKGEYRRRRRERDKRERGVSNHELQLSIVERRPTLSSVIHDRELNSTILVLQIIIPGHIAHCALRM